MDLLFVDTTWGNQDKPENETTPCLNIVDWGTGKQAVVRFPGRESSAIRQVYRKYWLRAYGGPKRLISDQEKGIIRGIFADRASAGGAVFDPVGAESECQNGKAETAAELWNRTYYRIRLTETILTAEDQEELFDAVNCAVNERGPDLRVFGKGVQLPE
eukprot:1320376-Pyramimonas_sp.AAC.1